MILKREEALVESLADLLNVPENGEWYQVTAYVKRTTEGCTVTNFCGLPIKSGRTLRLIDESLSAKARLAFQTPSEPGMCSPENCRHGY